MSEKKQNASRYDKKFDKEVLKLWLEGKWVSEIANHFGVSRETMDTWRKVHPTFDDAYKLGNALAAESFMRLPLIDEKLEKLRNNPQFFTLICKNVYGIGRKNFKLKGNESSEELLRIALDLVAGGEASETQIKYLMDGAINKVRIDEHNILEQRMAAVETKLGIQGKDNPENTT